MLSGVLDGIRCSPVTLETRRRGKRSAERLVAGLAGFELSLRAVVVRPNLTNHAASRIAVDEGNPSDDSNLGGLGGRTIFFDMD